jgi:hypothetical protein
MKHFASPAFWKYYRKLIKDIQVLADQKFNLLKTNSQHPSLHLKKVGKYWSVRVGLRHRALAVEIENNLIWFWIGTHAEYDELLK